jgi:site-specific recombinase XerD
MLDTIPLWVRIRSRLRDGPLGPHLDNIIEGFQRQGYKPKTVRRYIHAADRLSVWMRRCGKAAEDLDEVAVEQFVSSRGRHRSPRVRIGRLPDVASGARKIAASLWQQGIATRRRVSATDSGVDRWLKSFDEHLDRVKGLSSGSRRIYLRYASAFIDAKFGVDPIDWSAVSAGDVAAFVTRQAAKLKASSCSAPVTATRAMLRFLVFSGEALEGLDGAVPTIRQWKQAALPRHLTAEQVEAVLDCCSQAAPTRSRDRAILLLLVRLGLRGGEVVAMQLDDIDWREGVIRVRPGKSGRERLLPMTEEIGESLVSYVTDDRPPSTDRGVFLRSIPPYCGLRPSTVSVIAKTALKRAGITGVPLGSHTLRHTAATLMVRQGVPFKEVADVLGHALLETTTIYAKLDLESLSGVALPWPEQSS